MTSSDPSSDFHSGGSAVGVIEFKPAAVKPKPKAPKLWHVVLVDDDDHSYEYVIALASKVFRKSLTEGLEIAKTVDKRGRAICMTTHRELAELKQQQIHSFGADPLVASSAGAMSAVLVPADVDED